jgi:hypothetical protein
MHIINKTPFQVLALPTVCHEDKNHLLVIIKASFEFNAGNSGVSLCDKQLDIFLEDKYWGEEGESSLRYEADMALVKPKTDVIVNGNAYSGNKPVRALDVGIQVGSLNKVIRVFGNRYWVKSGSAYQITGPEPFEVMPMTYENAYGGRVKDEEAGITHGDERNPVGKGFILPSLNRPESGLPLPNLENPAQLITNWQHKPEPCGTGYIARSWLPRKILSGTYDEQWLQQRSPLMPEDFDIHSNNAASPGLQAEPYLQGGEAVKLVNLSQSGPINFTLPEFRFTIESSVQNRRSQHSSVMDTLLIEPEYMRLSMVWRVSFQIHWNPAMIDWIRVTSPERNMV